MLARNERRIAASWALIGVLLLLGGPADGAERLHATRSVAGGELALSARPLAARHLYLRLAGGSAPGLFGDGGAAWIQERLGLAAPLPWGLEVGAAVAGRHTWPLGLAGLSRFDVFGDVSLSFKWARGFAPGWFLALVGGYDLYQGIPDRSTVADTASPSLAAVVSYAAPAGTAPLVADLHVGYTYDRTVNLLGATRPPRDVERFAWQMRDDLYWELAAGVAWEGFSRWRPSLEGRYRAAIGGTAWSWDLALATLVRLSAPWRLDLALDLGGGEAASRAPEPAPWELAATLRYLWGRPPTPTPPPPPSPATAAVPPIAATAPTPTTTTPRVVELAIPTTTPTPTTAATTATGPTSVIGPAPPAVTLPVAPPAATAPAPATTAAGPFVLGEPPPPLVPLDVRTLYILDLELLLEETPLDEGPPPATSPTP